MATQRFYDGQPGPDIRRELNNFEAILDGTVAAAQDASTDATSASVKAQQWADAAPGVAVEPGKYSAKHWAARAQTTVTGGLIYRGSYSAASGAYPATPSLGDYYKISAAGTLGGVAYSVGDSIIYNGTGWDKIDSTDAVTSVAGRTGAVVLTKGDVGLGNVDNTSDANKPVSSATQTALNTKANLASPSFTGNVIAASSPASVGIAELTGSNSGYESRAQGNGGTAGSATFAFHRPGVYAVHFGLDTDNRLKVGGWSLGANAYAIYHENNKPTKADVGLGNVDNTRDVDKPISTATQNALNGKEPTIAAGTATQYWRGDKTWRDFFTDVRAATLTGLSTATNAVVGATDTVLAAIGKLQAQVSAKFDKTGGDVGGNINFTGTARRITGDFSNATVANRAMFQTSTANGNTVVSTLPSGSGTTSGFRAYGSDNLLNGVSADLIASISSGDVRLISNVYGTGAYLPLAFYTGGSERMRIDTSGNVLVTSPAVLGYGVGAGGAVVQATNKFTAVTLNKPTGQITMNNAALAAGASVSFQVNNTLVLSTDTVVVTAFNNTNYRVEALYVVGGGNFGVRVTNVTGGSLAEALQINFTIIKGATS